MNTADYTAGLRALADFYDARPELPVPTDAAQRITTFEEGETPAGAARIAKQLGSFEKSYDPSFFTLTKMFGPVELKFIFWRCNVCERRVVGTKTTTQKIPVGQVTYEDREVEEEIVEWDCPPLLVEEAEAKPPVVDELDDDGRIPF